MTILPIVERELRVASRKRGTYWLRVLAALVAIVVFGWMTLTLFRINMPSAMHGRFLFRSLFSFAFVYCLLIGARLTADCLSEEKREGTLGLLFLTDLKGYDVVLGKLAATSVNSVYALVAILPVISLPVQLGGVTASELFQSALVLLNTLFFSLSAGVLVSTLSRNERKAVFATLLILFLATFGPGMASIALAMGFSNAFNGPELWPLLALSPGFTPAYVVASVTLPPASPTPYFLPGGTMAGWVFPPTVSLFSFFPVPKTSFWWSLLLVQALSWWMLLLASWILPRIWQARASNSSLDRHRERIEQWTYGAAAERRSHRTRLLTINPFLWLAGRERWKSYYVWLYLAAVSATWLWGWSQYKDVMFDRKTLVPGLLLFQVFLKIWIVSEACNRLAEDRSNGALELLLSSPLTTRDILRGQWLALRRQFAIPLLAVMVVEYLVLRRQFSTEVIGVNLAMLVADAITLGWVGMWMGLTARNTSRAILGAVGRVLILPWGIYYAGGIALDLLWRVLALRPFQSSGRMAVYSWLAVGIASDLIFGLVWARRSLVGNFRAVAVQRFEPEKGTGWSGLFPRKRPGSGGSLAPVS